MPPIRDEFISYENKFYQFCKQKTFLHIDIRHDCTFLEANTNDYVISLKCDQIMCVCFWGGGMTQRTCIYLQMLLG